MKQGTVKFFKADKGFGFIVDNNSGEEIFVHISGCEDEIQKNDIVTFDTQDGKKGLNAVNVRLAA